MCALRMAPLLCATQRPSFPFEKRNHQAHRGFSCLQHQPPWSKRKRLHDFPTHSHSSLLRLSSRSKLRRPNDSPSLPWSPGAPCSPCEAHPGRPLSHLVAGVCNPVLILTVIMPFTRENVSPAPRSNPRRVLIPSKCRSPLSLQSRTPM